MAPTLPFTGLDPVEIFAVEDTIAQIVWRGLPPGELRALVGDREVVLGEAGRAGAAEIAGLRPDSTREVDITVDGRLICQRTIRTEPALQGDALFRVATIGDLHLGEEGFGFFKEMREHPALVSGYPMRCALAAVREAVEWGAQLLVIKGDITEAGATPHWDLVDQLLADIPIPVTAVPGNHDTVGKLVSLNHTRELQRRGLPSGPLEVIDVPGVRIVTADTTVPRHSWGRLRRHSQALADAADVATPMLLFLHHHLEQFHLPYFWPPGTPRRDARPALDAVLDINPDLVVSSGHTHRNRARHHRTALITEVGSTKDHPGVWAGYAIHADGVRQVVRRVAEPSCLEWNDRTHAVVGGLWGLWTPGTMADRSLTHRWSRPVQVSSSVLASSMSRFNWATS